MTAKEYLQQVKRQDAALKNLQGIKEELTAKMYSICAGSHTEHVQSSKDNDRFGTLYGEIDKKEREIAERIVALMGFKLQVTDKINALSSDRYITILYRRYIAFETWEEIAIAMQYNTRYVQHMHGQALLEFERMYSAELAIEADRIVHLWP